MRLRSPFTLFANQRMSFEVPVLLRLSSNDISLLRYTAFIFYVSTCFAESNPALHQCAILKKQSGKKFHYVFIRSHVI